jgi:HD superfamily phosphohydrolase
VDCAFLPAHFRRSSQSHPRKYLYDVVANARNSVDVDKMDYLQRDWSEKHSCIGCV